MTQHTQRLRTAVLKEIDNLGTAEAVDRLFELGLLSPLSCEALAIRCETEHLVRQGHGRCEAMEAVAKLFCCSYGKVRGAVYNAKKI